MAAQNNNPDAIADILEGGRFAGFAESIGWLTSFIDQWFTLFISVIAFFIISAALLRNVVAGAYAAYPKLWDTVAEIKENVAASQLSMGGKDFSILARAVAFFIPDLKAMSDFHDNTVEPKHYFMKAIPQMIGVVMIGIVIYNGYYRDAVVVAGNFGSEIIDRLLLNTDPVALIDKALATAGRPDFAYADDKSDRGKLINDISLEVYAAVIGKYSDIDSSAHKADLASNIETFVAGAVDGIDGRHEKAKFKQAFQVSLTPGAPNLDSVSAGDTDIIKTHGFSTPAGTLATYSKKNTGEEWNVRLIIRTTEIPEKTTSVGTLSGVTMSVAGVQTDAANGRTTLEISDGSQFVMSRTGKVGGFKATIEGSKLIVEGKLDMTQKISVTGLSYKAPASGDTAAKNHNIGTITAGTSVSFSKGEVKWGLGSAPPTSNPGGEVKKEPATN